MLCMESSKERHVSVTIYGSNSSEFEQHRDNLIDYGYNLSFFPELHADISKSEGLSIEIVNHRELKSAFASSLIANNLPYLVYNLSQSSVNHGIDTFLHESVGFFNGKPTLAEICLKIELGLHWHSERLRLVQQAENLDAKIENSRAIGIAAGLLVGHTALEVNEVFSSIKTVSQKKRRRENNVAKDIIKLLTPSDLEEINTLPPIPDIHIWLENNISTRQQLK